MAKSKQLGECSCGLNLGMEDLQSPINQRVDFLCATNSENTKIKTKLEELKKRTGEYYFDKDNKLIAIPNQILNPRNPAHFIDSEETLGKNILNRYIHYRGKLHLSLIKAFRELKLNAFVFQGFQSKNYLKPKLEESKHLRRKQQCTAKNLCNCGKVRYPDLNIFEKDIMELLDIRALDDKEIDICCQLLKDLKSRENTREVPDGEPTKVEELHGESWLFSKVNLTTEKFFSIWIFTVLKRFF